MQVNKLEHRCHGGSDLFTFNRWSLIRQTARLVAKSLGAKFPVSCIYHSDCPFSVIMIPNSGLC